MKKIIFLLIVGLFAFISNSNAENTGSPFAGKTKHKKVKKMKRHQVKNAQKGKTFYYRSNGKLIKRR